VVVTVADEIRVSPTVCAYPDENDESLFVDIELPGIDKDNIKLKINEDSFYIEAKKEGMMYAGTYVFCCPVNPDEAKAKYNNGLLTITVPYKMQAGPSKEIAIA
jgi:HSP20 family protein